MAGMSGVSAVAILPFGGILPAGYALGEVAFTPAMAIRPGTKAFDTAPIFQGKWDATGTPDVVTFPRGTLLGNQTKYFYSNLDPYQGSVSFWITFEHPGADNVFGDILVGVANVDIRIARVNTVLRLYVGGQFKDVSIAAWAAGTAYHVVCRWDKRNTLDGTNYACVTVNDVHSFGITTQPTSAAPLSNLYLGAYTAATNPASAIIEGLCISRVPFWDGSYGCPMWFNASGRIDAINAIYAAGAGADPAQIFGSWDCTFFLPTDQAVGPLQTTGQAWSHPHGSELVPVAFVDDGGLPGTDYAVEFNSTSTYINCGSGATLDDIPAGGAVFTVGCWVRLDTTSLAGYQFFVGKGLWTSTGWQLYLAGSTGNLTFYVNCDTNDAVATLAYGSGASALYDGKWHYVVGYYNDTAKAARVSLDGKWSIAEASVGAYTSDAAQDLLIGRYGGNYSDGAIAWVEISDNNRHTAGTDFVPPRYPYLDGNTIEAWLLDEGTGATVAASVTTPANDGTIFSGTWSGIWAVVGTPEIPQSLQFFAQDDTCDFGSGVNIDDLPLADCTMEFYARIPKGQGSVFYFVKGQPTIGWQFYTNASGEFNARIKHATNDLTINVGVGPADGRWHHIALDWTVATLTGRLFIDGILAGTDVAIGAYVADNAGNCILNYQPNYDGLVTFGWIRLSNNRRYTGNSFIPASRNNPPGADANAMLLVPMTDGAGATVTDISASGYNGTITFGASTRWNNTPDLAIDEPGKQIYNQGYNFGSDGANDGIYIPFTLTAAKDYVIRVPLQYSPRAWPRITLYDVTAAGSIVDFDAPPLSAVHDGGAGAAAFTSTGEVYPASLIGGVIYNPTDGSSGTITAVGGTNQDTITATLAGGGSNDWQVGEQAYIVPPTGWVFNEPISARTSANTAYELRITNRNSDGIITLHQAEVLPSLLTNGGMETGAGVPWVPTGWVPSGGLIAGETVQDLVAFHAGLSSLGWANGDPSGDYFTQSLAIAAGTYVTYGGWQANVTGGDLVISSVGFPQHNSLTQPFSGVKNTLPWQLATAVVRSDGNGTFTLDVATGLDVFGNQDDMHAFVLDAVTLTVTPASAANSLEGGNLRVDGYDVAIQTLTGNVTPNSGSIRWAWIPRHTEAIVTNFNATPFIASFIGAASNYIQVYWAGVNQLRLAFNNNTGEVNALWNTGGGFFVPGTRYQFEVEWNAVRMRLYVDGVVRITINSVTNFTDAPITAYWGTNNAASRLDGDAVFDEY